MSTLIRLNVRPGTMFVVKCPYSEVCMHMRVAGKLMAAKIVSERAVQLYDIQTQREFSAPILLGEGGVFHDDDGYYIYRSAQGAA